MSARTTIEGERFLHKDLWRVVEQQVQRSTTDQTGAFYDDLVAMVFAPHALEAYLNYVGRLLAPEVWADERDYFRKVPYRGFAGKVRKVLELAGVCEPAKDARPYKTVWSLKAIRDLIAHAKPEVISQTVDHDAHDIWVLMPSSLNDIVTQENARQAPDDIRAFAQAIHDSARLKLSEDIWFGAEAFGGALQYGYGSGSTTTHIP